MKNSFEALPVDVKDPSDQDDMDFATSSSSTNSSSSDSESDSDIEEITNAEVRNIQWCPITIADILVVHSACCQSTLKDHSWVSQGKADSDQNIAQVQGWCCLQDCAKRHQVTVEVTDDNDNIPSLTSMSLSVDLTWTSSSSSLQVLKVCIPLNHQHIVPDVDFIQPQRSNPIYYFYEEVALNSEGLPGNPGDKHYKCYHGSPCNHQEDEFKSEWSV